jgi:hypothetical protein
MGPTAGSGGLGLIVGVLEGAMGDLVGLRAFPGAAHDDVVCGGWVNHRIFFQILAISLVPPSSGRLIFNKYRVFSE